jgi:hypothetical protein
MTHGTQKPHNGRLRNILLATDFSNASALARDYALALAAPDAAITLVHAHGLPLPSWPPT